MLLTDYFTECPKGNMAGIVMHSTLLTSLSCYIITIVISLTLNTAQKCWKETLYWSILSWNTKRNDLSNFAWWTIIFLLCIWAVWDNVELCSWVKVCVCSLHPWHNTLIFGSKKLGKQSYLTLMLIHWLLNFSHPLRLNTWITWFQ